MSKVESVAVETVTVAVPPSSLMLSALTSSDSVTAPSSSRIVSATSAGAVTPAAETVPDTVTVLSSLSSLSSVASMVTAPVLCAAPAAKLSVVPLRVKSAASAGATAAALTVTSNATADTGETRALTVLEPPSNTASGVSTSVTVGLPSLSAMVMVRAVSKSTPPTEPVTMTVSPGSAPVSSTPVIVVLTLEAAEPAPAGSTSEVASMV